MTTPRYQFMVEADSSVCGGRFDSSR